MKEIISLKNPLIKEVKKLHKRKYREEKKAYLLEGFHLLEEAQNFGAEFEWLFFTERGKNEWMDWLDRQEEGIKIFLSDEAMKAISEQPSPQGIVAVVKMTENILPERFEGGWLLLDNVQDPGNVGAMIRTADAAGLAGVVLGSGAVDIYNAKVMRAMQGSNFHLPIFREKLPRIISKMQEDDIKVYGTKLDKDAVSLKELPVTENFAILMGNEGQGVSEELLDLTDENVYIKMKGQAESLNVAVACGILLFHFA